MWRLRHGGSDDKRRGCGEDRVEPHRALHGNEQEPENEEDQGEALSSTVGSQVGRRKHEGGVLASGHIGGAMVRGAPEIADKRLEV